MNMSNDSMINEDNFDRLVQHPVIISPEVRKHILDNEQLLGQVTKILINHCGETGENEGLIETLERKLK